MEPPPAPPPWWFAVGELDAPAAEYAEVNRDWATSTVRRNPHLEEIANQRLAESGFEPMQLDKRQTSESQASSKSVTPGHFTPTPPPKAKMAERKSPRRLRRADSSGVTLAASSPPEKVKHKRTTSQPTVGKALQEHIPASPESSFHPKHRGKVIPMSPEIELRMPRQPRGLPPIPTSPPPVYLPPVPTSPPPKLRGPPDTPPRGYKGLVPSIVEGAIKKAVRRSKLPLAPVKPTDINPLYRPVKFTGVNPAYKPQRQLRMTAELADDPYPKVRKTTGRGAMTKGPTHMKITRKTFPGRVRQLRAKKERARKAELVGTPLERGETGLTNILFGKAPLIADALQAVKQQFDREEPEINTSGMMSGALYRGANRKFGEFDPRELASVRDI